MAAADPQVRIALLERELQWAHLKIQVLEERLRKHRIGFLGPSSETLSDLQLELLIEHESSTTREEVEAESRREPIAEPRERKPHRGRKPLPENLPRIEEVIACEANCARCGGATAIIGYDWSEVLDREPAKWFVRVTKREKRACGKCSEVRMAELAPRIVDKGLASDRVVIETVVSKYCDHLPLYRQEAMMEREAGVEISRATLDGWVMRVGELLEPVIGAMRVDLLRASYIQADETIVPVQMHDGRGSDHQAYLWQYGTLSNGRGGETVFDFQLGRGRDGPAKFLKDWNGILQRRGDRNGHAHGRVVFGGSSRTAADTGGGRTRRIASGIRAAVGGGNSFRVCEAAFPTAAEERLGRSGELHLKYVGETAAVFRSRRGGVIQQRSGEFDASDRVGSQELVACGQREVGTQGRGDFIGGGILPPAGCAGQRVSAGRPAGNESKEIIKSRSADPCPVERRSHPTWVGLTDTLQALTTQG